MWLQKVIHVIILCTLPKYRNRISMCPINHVSGRLQWNYFHLWPLETNTREIINKLFLFTKMHSKYRLQLMITLTLKNKISISMIYVTPGKIWCIIYAFSFVPLWRHRMETFSNKSGHFPMSQDIVLFAFSRMYSISTFLTPQCIHFFFNYDLKIITIIILTI